MAIVKTIVFHQLRKRLQLYKELFRDPRTPKISKVLLGIAIAYFILPFDIIPDFIPVLGQLDDMIVIPALIYLAIRFIPKNLYQEHSKKLQIENIH